MKRIRYRQCELRKRQSVQIAWIPTRFAMLGRVLRIRSEDSWSTGWCVSALYREVDESLLPDAHRSIREHRKSTGDTLPRRN